MTKRTITNAETAGNKLPGPPCRNQSRLADIPEKQDAIYEYPQLYKKKQISSLCCQKAREKNAKITAHKAGSLKI